MDLINENNKRQPSNKSRKGKLLTRNELKSNVDRRIDILLSQKRNLEQSLHYEEKLQENLVEYLNGQQRQGSNPNRRDVEKISEDEEDIE